jgi:hypothetical protein
MAGKRSRLNFASPARAGSGKGKKAGSTKQKKAAVVVKKKDETAKTLKSLTKLATNKPRLNIRENVKKAIKKPGFLRGRGPSNPRSTKRK